jgi:hypothetical protein
MRKREEKGSFWVVYFFTFCEILSRFTAQSAPIILLPDYVPVRIESGLTLALKDFFQMSHAELKLNEAEIAAS